MGKIPILKPEEVIRVLKKLGFEKETQKGSHIKFEHNDGRRTTVPYHKGRDISPITLKHIIRDIRMSVEEFIKELK